jgi:hypothetical protein
VEVARPTRNELPRVIDRCGVNNFAVGLNIRVAADSCIGGAFSIANPQKFLPLAKSHL